MRPALRVKEVNLTAGLVTQLPADMLDANGFVTLQNMQSFTDFRSLRKVDGSSVVSAGYYRKLLYHEFFDLDGTTKRHLLALSTAGELKRIIGGNATLATGLANEKLASAAFHDRLHFTSASNDPSKYDGYSVTRWGVHAPAELPIDKLTLDTASGWVPSGTNTVGTSLTRKQGVAALSFTKSDTSTFLASADRAGLGLDLSGGSGYAYLWVYLPMPTFDVLSQTLPAVQVYFGNAGLTNASVWSFYLGELFYGWNLLSMQLSAPDAVVGAGATLAAIDTMRLVMVTKNNGDTGSMAADWLYVTASGTPSVALGAAGNPNEARRYRVTFVTKYGFESNAGPISASVTAVNQRVNLTNVPTSADPQVISRRLYCDLAADGLWRFVLQIDDNVSTTATDNLASASLGATGPPLAGSATLDHSRPEKMLAVRGFRGHLFGINAARAIELILSEASEPEAAPLVSRLLFPEEIRALENHAAGLLAFSSDRTFLITGSGIDSDPFVVSVANESVGANGPWAVTTFKSSVVVVHEERVLVLADLDDPWLLSGPIYGMIRDDPAYREEWFLIHDRGNMRLLLFGGITDLVFGYPTSTTCLAYEYGTRALSEVSSEGPGIDPMDVRLGYWSSWLMPWPFILDAETYETAAEVPRLAVSQAIDGCLSVGKGIPTWHVNGVATAISATFSFWVKLSDGPTGRGRVRLLETSAADGSFGTSWTVTVAYYDDPLGSQLASVSVSVPATGPSIVPVPRPSVTGGWAKITYSNSLTSGAGKISKIRVHYIPRWSHRRVA